MTPLEGEQLGFLEQVIKTIKKYGLGMIFKALTIILLFTYVMVHGADLLDDTIRSISIKAVQQEQIERQNLHDAALTKRREIKPKVDKLLLNTLNTLNADRCFVLEMHNGTNNVSGLPFLYGEMTYDVVSEGTHHIDDEYTSLLLSRFKLPNYLRAENVWQGRVDELKTIDNKFYHKLKANDASYLAIIQIHGIKNELGFFGITYCNDKEPKSPEIIFKQLLVVSQKLSTLLDSNNVTVSDEEILSE